MDGDTVLVAPGYYQENLVIDRSIVLASHAIYDNLDEWVVFDDFMFFDALCLDLLLEVLDS